MLGNEAVPSRSFLDFDEHFSRIIAQSQPEKPTALFHYTLAAGLHGLVHSKAFWATHFEYTNDAQEVRYGVEIVLDVLRGYVSEAQDGSSLPFSGFFDRSTGVRPSEMLMQVGFGTLATPEIEKRCLLSRIRG